MAAVSYYLPFAAAAKPTNLAVPNARYYFFQPGSSTLSPVYATSALTTQLSNPVVADGAGWTPAMYLDGSLTYRHVITDKLGAVLFSRDPYIPGEAPDASSLAPYSTAAAASASASASSASASAASQTAAAASSTSSALSAASSSSSAASAAGLLSSIATVPTAGMSLSAASRAALALLATDKAVILHEVGREGVFAFDSSNLSAKVTADPLQGIYVAPSSDATGASGAWVRKYDGNIHAKWLGIVADGVTDDGPTVLAAYTLAFALAGSNLTGYGTATPSIVLPFTPSGINMGSTTLSLTKAIATYGETGATFGGAATWLKWDAGHICIIVNAQNCYFDGIGIQGGWVDSSTAEGEFHGIQAKYKFGYGRLFITHCQGDGIYARTDIDGGNCNGIYGFSATINNCRNGVRLGGNDTNGGWFGLLDVNNNRQAGVNATDGFGNGFSVIQTAGNGVQGISGTAPTCVFNNGHIFTVALTQATGASTNSPPATATNNTWWIYWKDAGAATSYAPQWVGGTIYREGGAVIVDGSSNASTIAHLYAENDQPPLQLDQAAIVRGGLVACGYGPNTRRAIASLYGVEMGPRAQVTGNLIVTGVFNTFGPQSGAALDSFAYLDNTNSVSQLGFRSWAAGVSQDDGYVLTSRGNGIYINGLAGVHLRFNGTDKLVVTNTGANVTGAFTATSSILSSGGGIGYATGAGGTATQLTSKATGVTLDKFSGDITLHAAALAASTTVSFVFTNNKIAAGDTLVLTHSAAGTFGSYTLNAHGFAAGSCTVDVRNVSLGSLSEAIVIRYAVVKTVQA